MNDQMRWSGRIKKAFVLIAFSVGVAVAVALAMQVSRIQHLRFLIPGYAIALALTLSARPCSPP